MSIIEKDNDFVDSTAVSISLSQILTVTTASSNPAYLVLTALDRDEYTAGTSGATGSLSGNGHTLSLSNISGDTRGAGIVFTYQASTGRYYSSTYGYLDQLTYNSSGSAGDVTNLSLFGTSSLAEANANASSAYAMMEVDAAGYVGSATVVTQPKFTGAVPIQATPDSIVAVADSFVGQAWNMNGCWVLASTIAADAGASLPVQSTLTDLPGQSNGEWVVVFNGPAGQSGNWESMVMAGEMVVIGTAGGGGAYHHLRLGGRQHSDAGRQRHLYERQRANPELGERRVQQRCHCVCTACGVAGVGRCPGFIGRHL